MMDEMKRQIRSWNSLEQASSLTVSEKVQEQLGKELHEICMLSYLIGREDVVARFEEMKAGEKMLRFELHPLFALKDPESTVVWDEPFEDAVEWFINRGVMTRAQFDMLSDQAKMKFFTLARVDSQYLIERVQAKVAQAIADGITQREFVSQLDEMFQALGVNPLEPWHADLVYRQNVITAFQAGHYDALFDPDVAEFFPYLEYVAVGDDKTRETHQAMNGQIYRRDDPIWQEWYPPNGFNCRCTAIAISTFEAERRGVKPDVERPKIDGVEVKPDDGFASNPSHAFRTLPE